MKTKLLVTTILLLIATSMIASNPNIVRSKKHTESGSVEEIVLHSESNAAPSLKCIKTYDFAGVLQEKVKFQWNKYTNNWQPVSKNGYSQNTKTKKFVIAYTKWDNKNNRWDRHSEVLTYDYKDDGMLSMAVEQDQR